MFVFILRKTFVPVLFPIWSVRLNVAVCLLVITCQKQTSQALPDGVYPFRAHLHCCKVVFLDLACNVCFWRWLNEKQHPSEDGTSVSDIRLVPLIFKGGCIRVRCSESRSFPFVFVWSLNCYLICVLLSCKGCEMIIALSFLLRLTLMHVSHPEILFLAV